MKLFSRQPPVGPLIVEIQNIYDSDGIALGNINLTQDLFPLNDTVTYNNLTNAMYQSLM